MPSAGLQFPDGSSGLFANSHNFVVNRSIIGDHQQIHLSYQGISRSLEEQPRPPARAEDPQARNLSDGGTLLKDSIMILRINISEQLIRWRMKIWTYTRKWESPHSLRSTRTFISKMKRSYGDRGRRRRGQSRQRSATGAGEGVNDNLVFQSNIVG
jgi:hypothetical protein